MDLTWEEVLKRDDIVGRDIETTEDDVCYRGPISKAELRGDLIYFECTWMARLDPQTLVWKSWHIDMVFCDAELCPPHDIGEGRILFDLPYLGFGIILPKGGSKLDPSQVEGLKIAAS